MKRTTLPILIAVLMLAAAVLACNQPKSTQAAKPPTVTSIPVAVMHGLELKAVCSLEGGQLLWLVANRTSNNEPFTYTLDGGEGSGGVARGFEIQGFLLTSPGEHTVALEYAGIEDSLTAASAECEAAAAKALPDLNQGVCQAVLLTPAPGDAATAEPAPQSCAGDEFTLAYRCIPDAGKMEWTVEARGSGKAAWKLDGQAEGVIELPEPGSPAPLMVLPGGLHTVELRGPRGGSVTLSSRPGECVP